MLPAKTNISLFEKDLPMNETKLWGRYNFRCFVIAVCFSMAVSLLHTELHVCTSNHVHAGADTGRKITSSHLRPGSCYRV